MNESSTNPAPEEKPDRWAEVREHFEKGGRVQVTMADAAIDHWETYVGDCPNFDNDNWKWRIHPDDQPKCPTCQSTDKTVCGTNGFWRCCDTWHSQPSPASEGTKSAEAMTAGDIAQAVLLKISELRPEISHRLIWIEYSVADVIAPAIAFAQQGAEVPTPSGEWPQIEEVVIAKATHKLWNRIITTILGDLHDSGKIDSRALHEIHAKIDPTQNHAVYSVLAPKLDFENQEWIRIEGYRALSRERDALHQRAETAEAQVGELRKENERIAKHVGTATLSEAFDVLVRTKSQDEDVIQRQFDTIKSKSIKLDTALAAQQKAEAELAEVKKERDEAKRDQAAANTRYHRATLGDDARAILDLWVHEDKGQRGDPSLGKLQARIQLHIEKLRSNSGWVALSERAPTAADGDFYKGFTCAVQFTDGNQYWVCRWDDGDRFDGFTPTHWRKIDFPKPLPSTPSDKEREEKKIITRHVLPPIPIRTHDWHAYFDGEEEDGPIGWGETKEKAIEDLPKESASRKAKEGA